MEYVICVFNTDYEASLEKGKIYPVLEKIENINQIKIIDESHESYLYNTDWFYPYGTKRMELAEKSLK